MLFLLGCCGYLLKAVDIDATRPTINAMILNQGYNAFLILWVPSQSAVDIDANRPIIKIGDLDAPSKLWISMPRQLLAIFGSRYLFKAVDFDTFVDTCTYHFELSYEALEAFIINF